MTAVTARAVAPSLDALLGADAERVPFSPREGLSHVPMARVTAGGERYVLKWIGPRIDWVARAWGDVLPEPRAVYLWRTGVLDRLPYIDATVEAIARDGDLHVLVQRDVGEHFVPEDDAPIAGHRTFLDRMAGMHAAFWSFRDVDRALTTAEQRYAALTPAMVARERAEGLAIDGVRAFVEPAWEMLAEVLPKQGARLRALAEQPEPLARAMAELPATLVHGDWKAGNIGTLPDGRTVLVDWAFPGAAPCTVDLGWYLAVNTNRLPESKDATIDAYRAALERHGVDTAPWWDRALDLALLGAMLQLGWSKALEPDELAWWVGRVAGTLDELA